MILGKSRASGRRGTAPVPSAVRVIELVPDFIVVATSILLVETHDVHHSLRVFLLLLLRDSVLLQQPLPLLGETGELASLVIIADMGDMDWILWGRDLHVARGAKHAVDEAGEAGLFASPHPRGRATMTFIRISLGVGRPFGLTMREGIHAVG